MKTSVNSTKPDRCGVVSTVSAVIRAIVALVLVVREFLT